MRSIYILVFTLSILFFLTAFVSKRKHLLATLLSLEGLLFMLFGEFYLVSIGVHGILPILFIFLTLTVCEGAIGLGILVSIVRSTGTDKLNSMNLLQLN